MFFNFGLEPSVFSFLQGFNDLPICMAKTHLSLSHNPELKGCPKGTKALPLVIRHKQRQHLLTCINELKKKDDKLKKKMYIYK